MLNENKQNDKIQREYMKDTGKKSITLKTLNKSNVWDCQENDIIRLLTASVKEGEFEDNFSHFNDIIKTAFEVEEVKVDNPKVIKKYEARGFQTAKFGTEEMFVHLAFKKKAILRVTDLTYENIRHISAEHLMEVLDRNFGSGWGSLSQSIQDIIESGFDVSTTTLPKDRLHKKGGMYEKKVEDGYAVLEIEKGAWVEVIFAKEKPMVEKPKSILEEDETSFNDEDGEANDDDMTVDEEEEDDKDDLDLSFTQGSCITTYEKSPEEADADAQSILAGDVDYE